MSDSGEEWELDLGLPTHPGPVLTEAARAKRSIASMVDAALESGATSRLEDLLDQVASFRALPA